MWRKNWLLGAFLLTFIVGNTTSAQQIGKFVAIPAGSEADHAIAQINATADPKEKLALLDKFAAEFGKGDMAIVADELYVNYYILQKNFEKAFEYGDKLFALDPDNLANAVNMIRAANEKGDADKLMTFAEKTQAILQRYKASPAPGGTAESAWEAHKQDTLQRSKDSIDYVCQAAYGGVYEVRDPAKRAGMMARIAYLFPDSPYAIAAQELAATSYQQAQNVPKMLEVANGLLAKDPNNLAMLVLLSDYYGEKGEQLDKAENYAKKAIALTGEAKKPEGVTDEQWQQQISLQKGLALSALGQVKLQKKDNAQAVENFTTAAPLLKSNEASYGRNQYWLGFALINLKRNAEAKEAFTQAASANGPYKALAQTKLKEMAAPARKRTS